MKKFEVRNRYYPHATLVCRAMQGTQIHIGKLFNNKCQLSENGSVKNADMYQVLVVKNKL